MCVCVLCLPCSVLNMAIRIRCIYIYEVTETLNLIQGPLLPPLPILRVIRDTPGLAGGMDTWPCEYSRASRGRNAASKLGGSENASGSQWNQHLKAFISGGWAHVFCTKRWHRVQHGRSIGAQVFPNKKTMARCLLDPFGGLLLGRAPQMIPKILPIFAYGISL